MHPRRAISKETLLLAGVLAVNLLMRLFVALRPLASIDGLMIPDDAYLSLTIAKNIAHGLGPLYGTEFTNGFQPLYVFLAAPFYWLWPQELAAPVHAALVLLALCDTLALGLLYRWLRGLTRGRLGPAVAAAAWIFSPYVLATTLNGLETMIAGVSLLGTLCFFQERIWPAEKPPRPGDALRLGLLLGLAVFARIDSAILGAALAALMMDGWRRERATVWPGLRALALIGLGALGVLLPWLGYSHHYTGDLYPVSGRAVRFMSLANVGHDPTLATWYWPMLRSGAAAVLTANRAYLGLGLILLALTLTAGRRRPSGELRARLRPLAPVAAFALLLFLAYTLYIFGDWYFSRYLFPITLASLAALAVLTETAAERLNNPAARRWLAVGLLAAVTGGQAAQPAFRAAFTGSGGRELGYMNVALWARDHIKPGTTVGSSQTGALGYFADTLKIVNLDGVVNKACFRSLVERHNLEYIRQVGIELILGWECNINFICAHSDGDSIRTLTWLNDVDGLRSWGFKWGLYKVNAAYPKGGIGMAATTPAAPGRPQAIPRRMN
jgi:hypothetical protein